MDYELIAAIIFIIFLTVYIHLKRSKLDTKEAVSNLIYFSMYRTSYGLSLMDKWAKKYNRFFKFLGYFGIVVGFLGMAFIIFTLLENLFSIFAGPKAVQGVGLVLPIKGKGIFHVPFSYWIICIFVIAVVHEFAHGVIARAHNLKVKSSGFAFLGSSFRGLGFFLVGAILFNKIINNDFTFNLSATKDAWLIAGFAMLLISFAKNLLIPIIPAAFVEPDEKEIKKKPFRQQLSVFAAGPLSNIIFGIIFFGLFFLLLPVGNTILEPDKGVKIVGYNPGSVYPIENASIPIGSVITKIDDIETSNFENLSNYLNKKKPGDVVTVKADEKDYELKLGKKPGNESVGFLGASFEQNTKINEDVKEKFGMLLPNLVIWTIGLLYFLVVLNLGIGLFNLVPAGPLDGGRMILLPLTRYFGKKKGMKIWYWISIGFGLIILFLIINSFLG